MLLLVSASAAAFYHCLQLLASGSYLGLILAAPIILVVMTFLLSWLLFGGSAAQKPKNKNS
jgi:hypothetical protein